MSEPIKHECGIALIRLLKPLEYYEEKYGTSTYGLNKLYLLMEKQHNRGQDGAGIANIKFDIKPGNDFIARERSNSNSPIKDIFNEANKDIAEALGTCPENYRKTEWLKENARFSGELFLGHLRYGTFGRNTIESCHPFVKTSNWLTKNFVLAGNFNLTNVDELFNMLINIGQHPKEKKDTITVLEKVSHFLDEEVSKLYHSLKDQDLTSREISSKIAKEMDIQSILQDACKRWDGGYAMAGLFGHGDAFVARDPAGIRPAFFYQDDEIVVVASERPVIQTAFNVPLESIKEIEPAHALIIKKDGTVEQKQFREKLPEKQCSFERIYFSRGTDADIYEERKNFGRYLAPIVLDAVHHDLANTVFSYIPNTAETCFYGMNEEIRDYTNRVQKEMIVDLGKDITPEQIDHIFEISPRVEKIAVKDAKLRTFITDEAQRDDLVAHVYDTTYGAVKPGDNLVVIDDSIVRGTTLKQSILRILDRLNPQKIIVVSSAPQIRYPDCYGIDMAKLGDFVAFRAAIELLKDTNRTHIIDDVYEKALAQLGLPDTQVVNYVKEIYAPFTDKEVSAKIAELLTPVTMKAEVEVIYQTVDGLRHSCPNHTGDWYFTGEYPTPGGNRVVNQSFINFIENRNERAY